MFVRSTLPFALLLGLSAFPAACGRDSPRPDDHDDLDSSGGGGGEPPSAEGGQGGTGGVGNQPDSPVGPVPGKEAFDCTAPEGGLPALTLTALTTKLKTPMQVAAAPGDEKRLFVAEQAGVIRVVEDEQLVDEPFLDIRDVVSRETIEEGLLGFAFHPDYAKNGLFYVHYSAENIKGTNVGDTVIEEYAVSEESPALADADSARVVLIVSRPETEGADHNGGTIVFGRDKALYIAMGDSGGVGTNPNGQDLSTNLGGMLRVNPLQSGAQPYSVPEGNLQDFFEGASPELWAAGLRNPFRASVDGCSGMLLIGDVGLDTWEEVNLVIPGQKKLNFGWPVMEGPDCQTAACDAGEFDAPAYFYPTSAAGGSITGGSVYRGSAIPALRGRYVFADASSGRIWSLALDVATGELNDLIEHTVEITAPVITSIENGPNGEIYFTSRLDNALYRLDSL